MTSVLRFLFVAGCTVQLLFLSTAFASSDRKPRVTGYCFGQRTPIGQRGRCTDEIRPPSNQTRWSGAKECCMLGGVGWTTKTNGKRCENACEEEEPVPYMKDVQSLVETPVMHKDKTNFQNVDGRWTAWGEWSDCDPCDNNSKTTRSRSCTNPPPSGDGSHCAGLQSMTRNCPGNCPDQNNGWSEWSDWTPCSAVQCGKQGFSLRSRSCTRMSPQTCPGNFLDINTCVAPGCSTGR